MSKILQDLNVGLDEDLKEKLQWLVPNYSQYRITRKSVDARRSREAHWVMTVEVFEDGEIPPAENFRLDPIRVPQSSQKPVIVGSGPAGLFAALRLVERGIPCVLLERGSPSDTRIRAINRFWRYGELNADDNVCFGEGGAGLYSDGKLITRIKSPYIPYVMHKLVEFGAPEEIKYLSNPHVGSDRIRRLIPVIRQYLLNHGCEIHFNSPMTKLLVDPSQGKPQVTGVETRDGRKFLSHHVVLATGHSAEDILGHLHEQDVFMEGKSFALGLRIEHPQKVINQIQFRNHAEHPALGAANYRLADHDAKTNVGVYSFCMCPGGYVLSSGTSSDGMVVNGMSNYTRNSPFANSAIVVSIDHKKRFGEDTKSLFSGLQFRKSLEQKALQAVQAQGGTHQIPAQRLIDFLSGRPGPTVKSSTPSGVLPSRLDQILPPDLTARLGQSIETFDSKMKGFIHDEAQLHGVESRTSCPVRVTRDDDSLESISHRGLYPSGEGAGYAGGITSAACDGIRVAEAIARDLAKQTVERQSTLTSY